MHITQGASAAATPAYTSDQTYSGKSPCTFFPAHRASELQTPQLHRDMTH